MRSALLVTALLACAAPATAQLAVPVKTTVLNKDVRLGTFMTASATVPVGTVVIQIRDTMSDADASDPTNHMVITVSVSADNLTWIPVQLEEWNGGTFPAKGTGILTPQHVDFAFGVAPGALDGMAVRAEMDIQTKITTGLTITMK